MSFHVISYFAVSTILLTHSKIASVNGQCTTEGCGHDDLSMSIIAEIQQQNAQALGPLNTQIQNIHDLLTASLQQMRSQHDAVMRSLQAVDRRLEEHDINIKQIQSSQELINESLQEIKSLQAVVQRSDEHDICIKQGQSFHELLNSTFQEIKSQHETVNKSFQAVDRRLLEQSQSIHVLLNESFQEMKSLQAIVRRSFEQDVCINQVRSIYEFLNESIQPTKSQHDTVRTSLQELDRLSHEHNVYIKQVPIIYELLNKSFQQMTNQFDAVDASLQTVDRNLENYQIDMKNQTEKSWKLVNDIWDAVYTVRDCSDMKARGYTTNGVYEVCVGHQTKRVCTNAFCDMETNNTASLVFQRRKDGSVNFNRTWAEYREGFGNPDGEFWLGNEMLYLLTSKRKYKLRVDLEDFNRAIRYAEYANFSISSSADNYTLTVGGYSGNAGDSLDYHSGRQFSTIDVDNDESGRFHCARTHGGAWWHGGCAYSTLNGKYYQRYVSVYLTGIHWCHWKNTWSDSLKATEMKLVPVA